MKSTYLITQLTRKSCYMDSRIFPGVLIILDVLAAIVYGFDGDIRKIIYWLAAAVLTAAVTFLPAESQGCG